MECLIVTKMITIYTNPMIREKDHAIEHSISIAKRKD
jgi:hypothetical protein